MEEGLFYSIALSRLYMVGPRSARTLIEHLGSARAVFETDRATLAGIGGIGKYLTDEGYRSEALRRAEEEMKRMEKGNIRAVAVTDEGYPRRLYECPDAPTVLYYTGNGGLQAERVMAVVGTRRVSDYGRDMTEALIRDMAASNPGTVVVSGLAYGVDVTAHRAALRYGLPTIGVVAHGLDRMYPPAHRSVAEQMCREGGAVVTEYMTETRPDPQNFVQRNRIIAGLADVTVVVESAAKGGSLITAGVANEYNRDVAAFPGRAGDEWSAGCNALIRRNRAQLVEGAADVVEMMKWAEVRADAVQQSLFECALTPEMKRVAEVLKSGDRHIDQISQALDMTIQCTSALLTEMVMEDVIRQLPGERYSLITKTGKR